MIAVGIVLVLLLGEIDLSVGSVSGLGAGVMGVLASSTASRRSSRSRRASLPARWFGFLHGFWFTRFRGSSFVVTLAGLLAWEGLLILIWDNRHHQPLRPQIDAIAGSFVAPLGGWILAVVALVLYVVGMLRTRQRRAKAGLETQAFTGLFFRAGIAAVLVLATVYILNTDRGTVMILILLAFVVGFDFITRRTKFGRHIYAVGSRRPVTCRHDAKRVPCF